MTLQGAFHFFLWCLLFLLAWGVFTPRFIHAIKVIFFSTLLSLVRLLPPVVEFIGGGKLLISGFPTVLDLFSAMLVLKFPQKPCPDHINRWAGGSWTPISAFSDLPLLLSLAFFKLGGKRCCRRSLLAPIGVLTFLSIGQVYSVINYLPIPLTDSERISSRFFILPLVFLIVLGSIHLQDHFTKQGTRPLTQSIFLLGLLALVIQTCFSTRVCGGLGICIPCSQAHRWTSVRMYSSIRIPLISPR